ncbi:MAG: hypothetical protein ACXAEU_26260 [Candidatus Hodarchaeales archaeon]|jgi:hypothetical protein
MIGNGFKRLIKKGTSHNRKKQAQIRSEQARVLVQRMDFIR